MTTQSTTTEITPTNDIRFKTSKTIGKETIYVSIRLNDECKNGHQDFAITGDLYEANKPKTDRYNICGGCIHEEIIKFFPEFKQFVNLHLCDYEGIPTYAVENGYYHLTNGFNNTKVEDKNFKSEFCEYYRLSPSQFDVLSTSRNQLQYALHIQNLGILAQWKKEADNAIRSLEDMTGKKFVVDSVKTQYHAPTDAQIKDEEEKHKNGYYTPEAEKQRANIAKGKLMDKLSDEEEKKIAAIKEEYQVKKHVLQIGGEKALNNCIYYNHSKTLGFNWRSYDMISDELVNKIITEISLPEGVTIENKKGK